MKKILAVIAAFATVISLASCKMESNKTTAERVSEAEAERSQAIEASIQAETKRFEKIDENIDYIGKTEKNKQIVIERVGIDCQHYQVYVFNRKGICNKLIDYYFYDSIEAFNIRNEDSKEKTRQKKIKSDPEARMVAFESDYDVEERNTYEQLYDHFVDATFEEDAVRMVK